MNEKNEKEKSADDIDEVLSEVQDQMTNDDIALENESETEDNTDSLLHEQQDKYVRLMAEFDNYKRRTARQYDRMVESANERLMLDIVETIESFDRALNMAEEKHDVESFIKGMKLIFNKLNDNVSRHGLESFGKEGDLFDPEIHDAMLKQPNENIEEDHIVSIYEKGYKLKTHIIKHARVIVSAGLPCEHAEDK